MLISIAYIQVQVCATNCIWKQFGETKIKQRHFHEYRSNQEQTGATSIIFIHLYAFRYKYVQPMACRHNQVLPDTTRIIWIQFPTFRYKYVQLMANRINYVQPGAKTGLLIHFQTFRYKYVQTKAFICIQVQVKGVRRNFHTNTSKVLLCNCIEILAYTLYFI